MKHAYTWGAILAIVLASTAGDVLLSRAMKRVGDVGELWRRSGLMTVAGRILRNPSFLLGIFMMAVAFYSLLFGIIAAGWRQYWWPAAWSCWQANHKPICTDHVRPGRPGQTERKLGSFKLPHMTQ